MATPSQCRYCGVILPPPHVGRGRQKQFCCPSHQVLFSWRKTHPRVTNKQRREKVFGERRARRWNEAEKAWLAAMFDGEGYIAIGRQVRGERVGYYFPALHIYNTNEKIISHANRLLGGDALNKLFSKNPGPRSKPVWAVKVDRGSIVPVLRAIMPYLVGKRRQAEILVDFCTLRDSLTVRTAPPPEYAEWFNEMRLLNRRGLPQEA